jgi:hypothetical protein
MNSSYLNRLCLILLFCSACSPVHTAGPKAPPEKTPLEKASPVSSATYLRKASLAIRGITPSKFDYEGLSKATTENRTAQFLSGKIREYLASDEHIDKMEFRLQELFELFPSAFSFASPLLPSIEPELLKEFEYETQNSLNELFRRITARNLTWDTLLLGKRYSVFKRNSPVFSPRSDSDYYSAVHSFPTDKFPQDLAFAGDDPRVAGALTTGRFIGRYGNTAVNKNRRRAAAIFRIFLCDDMKAVVVSEKDGQDGILDRVFPDQPEGMPGPSVRGDQRHGADAACFKCHYKLDPMGRTFQSTGLNLSPFASPGALVYTTDAGRKVDLPGRGIGEVAQAITEQPEYVQCQVRRFWNWFIGDDIDISSSTMAELESKFNEVHRQPNDFIAYLMTRSEFGAVSGIADPRQQLITDVKRILQHCNGCHSGRKVPNFTNWPIGGSDSQHLIWLDKIRVQLGMDGWSPRKMPTSDSVWQPSSDELTKIRTWLDAGGPQS